ncbi:MAG: integrase arm-type DNA-binding domain-containing protein [Deltaproteobacteria bacterium]|nr:integrase arm-type DNA-binding domain-containing protein [Deltaproteobacteria bacterium]
MSLTKKYIDSLRLADRESVYWDHELGGFGLRVRASGRKTFIVQYRNAQGRTRKVTVGQYGRLTLQEARKAARQILAQADKGQDPAEKRVRSKSIPTLNQLAERYLQEHALPKKKAWSVYADQRLLNKIILPALGHRKITEISRADVTRLHHSQRETPFQGNRVLALLSKMFSLADLWGLHTGPNPCKGIQRFKERKRERFLSGDELARLGHTLAQVEAEGSESPSVVTAIRLLLLTGARLGEVLTLKWEYIDPELGAIRLPDSKTGAKLVPLSAPAVEVLAQAPRLEGNPFVCPGVKSDSHLVGIQKPWQRIRARAGLDDVRLHDLRHSFASVGAAAGLGLPMLGALLGHTQAATTQRYAAHLANDPLKAASEEIGRRIAEAMTKKPKRAKVIPLKR